MAEKAGLQLNGKQIATQAISQALGAAKGNTGNMKSLKIKMKFGKDGEDDKPKTRSKSQGLRSFISSQRAKIGV